MMLSILIPTTYDRADKLSVLMAELERQICDDGLGELVEIIQDLDDKTKNLGQKRNDLYEKANGMYSLQYDSDDFIHPSALKLITNAICSGVSTPAWADCITYQERVSFDGRIYRSNHSIRYPDWKGDTKKVLPDGFDFWRTPYFKDVIKTEICRAVKVPHLRYGEDHAWSKLIVPLIKNEIHIDEEIYIYNYITDHTQSYAERYGLNNDINNG